MFTANITRGCHRLTDATSSLANRIATRILSSGVIRNETTAHRDHYVLSRFLRRCVAQVAANPTVAPYGSWRSPISAQMLVQGAVRFGDIAIDGDTLYWVEGRPEEQGRYVIVRRTPDGKIDDVLPKPFSARTTVHEYGGGAIRRSGRHRLSSRTMPTSACGGSSPAKRRSRSPPNPNSASPISCSRCAAQSPHRRVRRPHARTTTSRPTASWPSAWQMAKSRRSSKAPISIRTRASAPTARNFRWLAWNHPNMPWDGTELFVAPIAADGSIGTPRKVAGGNDESIFQPTWSPDGTLYFVSDRTNWWNLYAEPRRQGSCPILPMDAEFGGPQWVFGMTTYGFQARWHNHRPLHARRKMAPHANRPDVPESTSRSNLPYSNISSIDVAGDRVYAIAGSPTEPESLIEIDLATGKIASDPPQFTRQARSRLHFRARSDRISYRRRQNRSRVLLPASQSRLPRSRRRSAAAAGAHPRRPHRRHCRPIPPHHAVLDLARLRRVRRELRRQHRLRPRVSQPPPRLLGRRRRRTTPRTPQRTSPTKAKPTRRSSSSAAAAPAATPRSPASRSATSSVAAPATTASATSR